MCAVRHSWEDNIRVGARYAQLVRPVIYLRHLSPTLVFQVYYDTVARQPHLHAHIAVIIHAIAKFIIRDKIKIAITINIHHCRNIPGIIKSIDREPCHIIIVIEVFIKRKAQLITTVIIPPVHRKPIYTLLKKIGYAVAVIVGQYYVIVYRRKVKFILRRITVIRITDSTHVYISSQAVEIFKDHQVFQAVIVQIAHGELRIIKSSTPCQRALLPVSKYLYTGIMLVHQSLPMNIRTKNKK